MKLKNIIYSLFGASALLMAACNEIDSDDRFIYVEPAEVARKVLIEDFTGQKCINCPAAIDNIEMMMQQYGEENVIAVGIHSGPFGMTSTSKFLGLKTDTGQEYYDYWKVESQPSGLINRIGGVKLVPDWQGSVATEIQKKAPVNIALANSYNEDTRELQVNVDMTALEDISGKLQLWIIEDNIVAVQLFPGNERVDNYNHMHVFRAAINGTWGEDVAIASGKTLQKTASIKLADDWKAENVSVVAFVYNNSGVQQVEKAGAMPMIVEPAE